MPDWVREKLGNNDVDIASCPFCGHEPVVWPADWQKEGDAIGAVVCVNIDCQTYDSRRGHGVEVGDGGIIESTVALSGQESSDAHKLVAIKRWNTRSRR